MPIPEQENIFLYSIFAADFHLRKDIQSEVLISATRFKWAGFGRQVQLWTRFWQIVHRWLNRYPCRRQLPWQLCRSTSARDLPKVTDNYLSSQKSTNKEWARPTLYHSWYCYCSDSYGGSWFYSDLKLPFL